MPHYLVHNMLDLGNVMYLFKLYVNVPRNCRSLQDIMNLDRLSILAADALAPFSANASEALILIQIAMRICVTRAYKG